MKKEQLANMHFAHAAYPKRKITSSAAFLIYLLVVSIIIVACLQLMAYEKFVAILQVYTGIDVSLTSLFGAWLVLCEVLGIPFLLRMKLSIAFRYFSALSLAFSAAWWCFLGVWGAGRALGGDGEGVAGFARQVIFSGEILLLFSLCYLIFVTAAMYLLRDDVRIDR
jgi:hypothetical protein